MRQRFKNRNQQRFYEIMRTLAKQQDSDLYLASGARRTGAAHRNAYWQGLDGHPARYIRDSLCYACWRAGRDDRPKAA